VSVRRSSLSLPLGPIDKFPGGILPKMTFSPFDADFTDELFGLAVIGLSWLVLKVLALRSGRR